MENKKVFLDTNIVADIIDSTRDNHLLSLKLLEYLVLEDYIISISEDMITALYYILKGKKTILGFLEDVVFIDWTVLIFGKSVLEGAVKLSLEKDLDLEDTLQCLCAKENRCEMLITNDNKFYDCGIAIYSTKEFIEKNV